MSSLKSSASGKSSATAARREGEGEVHVEGVVDRRGEHAEQRDEQHEQHDEEHDEQREDQPEQREQHEQHEDEPREEREYWGAR